jgi:hypothetical protein
MSDHVAVRRLVRKLGGCKMAVGQLMLTTSLVWVEGHCIDPWWCSAVEGLVYWAWKAVELNMVPMQCYWSMVNDSALFTGHLRCLGHRWISMAWLASGWNCYGGKHLQFDNRCFVPSSGVGKSYTDQYHLSFYDILLYRFQFFSKRLKLSFCDFSTAIFFFAFFICYYDTISCLMAASAMVLYHEVR